MNKNRYKGGVLIFIIVNASLIFLLFSPYINNVFLEYLDDAFLEDVDDRIRDVRTDDFSITLTTLDGTPLSNVDVEYELVEHDFYFGCNLNFNNLGDNGMYLNAFENLFNLATINHFYWSSYEPEQGTYPRDDGIEAAINWCHLNNITSKGHPLAWRNPAGYPKWLPEDKSEVEQLLKERIERILGLYKGRIKVWDVVNEPSHLPPIGDQSLEDYVSEMFELVRELDPDAKLTLNDYGIIGHDFGYGPYYNLIHSLLENNVPIDYIGLQGREPRMDWIPATEIWATLEAYSAFDLPIHITEFTCPSSGNPITNSWKKGIWTEENQAEYAKRYYKTCFAHPSVEGFIWWDLWDGGSWVRNGGLLDEDFKPKLIYETLDGLINDEWHTEGTATTDNDGKMTFKGFFGVYEINLKTTPSIIIKAEKGKTTKFNIVVA